MALLLNTLAIVLSKKDISKTMNSSPDSLEIGDKQQLSWPCDIIRILNLNLTEFDF
jgi:hypothetical protein